MSLTMTISLYSTVNSALFSTWSMSASYPLVRNFRAFSTRFGVFTNPSRSGSSPSAARRFLTRSCILLLYIPLMGIPLGAQSADALYADRENIASAKRAAELYEEASKLARTCYWLGGHAPDAERRAFLEKGITAGQLASRLQASKPEGHFWTAANMGALAESFGIRQGMKYRRPI